MEVFKKGLCFFEDTRPTNCEVDYALLAARIATAIFFITHGYGKLFGTPGIEGFTGMLAGLGFPLVVLFAWLVSIAEFFGGIAILLGVFTRFSAFWLAIISFVAWGAVKGFSLGMSGGDLDILALGLTIALFFAGPGAISASAHMKKGAQQEM